MRQGPYFRYAVNHHRFAAYPPATGLEFDIVEKVACRRPKRFCDTQQSDYRDYVLASFDGTDVAPVHLDGLRQSLLA